MTSALAHQRMASVFKAISEVEQLLWCLGADSYGASREKELDAARAAVRNIDQAWPHVGAVEGEAIDMVLQRALDFRRDTRTFARVHQQLSLMRALLPPPGEA